MSTLTGFRVDLLNAAFAYAAADAGHEPSGGVKHLHHESDCWCAACGRVFDSSGSLDAHRARVQGYRNPLRRYIDSSHCPCCLKEFWDRERLLYHLCRAARCRDWAFANLAPMSAELARDLDVQAAPVQRRARRLGLPERFAESPAVRLQGPRPLGADRP